jgi:deoxyadenosine/deoxycytidine kinase
MASSPVPTADAYTWLPNDARVRVDVKFVFIEGNIGAGKSTALKALASRLDARLAQESAGAVRATAVLEPLARWKDVDGDGSGQHNALRAFYGDKPRNAYLFQSNAMITRIESLNDAITRFRRHMAVGRNGSSSSGSRGGDDGLHVLFVLAERSIYSDRHIFVSALARDGDMSPLEVAVYGKCHDFWARRLHAGEIAGLIYLRSDPTTCYARLRERARAEEAEVPLAYLEELHELHEQQVLRHRASWGGAKRLVLNVAELGDLRPPSPGVGAAAGPLQAHEAAAASLVARVHTFVASQIHAGKRCK